MADDAVNRWAGKWNSRGEPKLSAQVLMDQWPTPTVHGNHNRPYPGKKSGYGLATAVTSWPTPTVQDSQQAGGKRCIASGKRGMTLHQATQLWPTPTARDHSPQHKPEYITAKKAQGHGMSNLNDSVNGQLNPDWVEWLMGWPIGWTDLKPLETAKFREWQQQHSLCCTTFEEIAA
nr:hypothetical protein [Chromobacterium sp. ASV5]